jgi:hypothetical protein
VPEPEVKYEPRHDREGYKKQGEEYTHEGKEKEYDHGHEQYGPGQYNKKEYSDGYTKYSYDYKSRDKPPKEYKEDYGPPPYNPKAHENYEYDRCVCTCRLDCGLM